jgi:small subunit ribosomal protein S17
MEDRVSTESEEDRRRRKVRMGQVVSDKMDKTIVVMLERQFPHPSYSRIVRRTSRIKVHDENNECRVGDVVRVMETRPLSKEKRWRLLEVVRKAQ